ncbi:hypothetical protein T265_04175 [Opisthorchis viverrini]|uniref:Uncharacterized protein n=1 Tax=Opisthorchis viverrini TaxID=6198 RepID=A0A074ZTQ4_OPIVI|nr:hypothetical protein T265_04175 [Opisthorchis viverrini]KER29172.1 hypothetical protein T265_04175 [Opisthorchis viverrini]
MKEDDQPPGTGNANKSSKQSLCSCGFSTFSRVDLNSFSCNTLSVSSCHSTRRKHEDWDTARLPKPRQGMSSGGGRIRTTDLPVNRSVVVPFRCLAVTHHEGGTRAGILPGRPSLDKRSREAEIGFEPQIFQSVKSRYNHLVQLAPLLVLTKADKIFMRSSSAVHTQCPCRGLNSGHLTFEASGVPLTSLKREHVHVKIWMS